MDAKRTGVTLAELHVGACRWPVAEGLYCGRPALRSDCFCIKHAAQSAAYRDRGQQQSTLRAEAA